MTDIVRGSRLRQVEESEFIDPQEHAAPAVATEPQPSRLDAAAFAMLFTALKAMSQRTVIAFANLYTLLLAASAFYIWSGVVIVSDPTVLKLIGASLYSVFVLALCWARRK